MAIGLLVGDYVVKLCNSKLLACWEWPLTQVLHQPLFEVLRELQYQSLQGPLGEVGRTGAPAIELQLPGQSAFTFLYYPLRDAQGQPFAIAAVAECTLLPPNTEL